MSESGAHVIANVSRLRKVQAALLGWFAEHGSDLPWRRAPEPYAVLVSEFMLQQTQRERVSPTFVAFMQRFPTLEALAAVPASAVIRAWAGLGYNSRALRLHRIARELVDSGRGLPSDPDELRRLPGIGAYTAGAVACYGFGQQTAFVDTNIRRVLRRVSCGDPYPEPRPKLDQGLATASLPAGVAVAWNSALMDLGALVCKAAAPRCSACPLQDLCLARPKFATLAAAPPRRVAERRAPYGARVVQRESFVASDRFLRGRIVDALRRLADGVSLDGAELALAATGMALPPQDERVVELAERLAAEGLLAVEPDAAGRHRYRLPD